MVLALGLGNQPLAVEVGVGVVGRQGLPRARRRVLLLVLRQEVTGKVRQRRSAS